MSNDWVIDVLNDLKVFAERNGMGATAAQLEDTCLVALAELAGPSGAMAEMSQRHEGGTGTVTHLAAKSDFA